MEEMFLIFCYLKVHYNYTTSENKAADLNYIN